MRECAVATSTDISDGRAESVPGLPGDPRYVPPATVPSSLVGRSDERRHLDELLEAVRANESRTLVIVGEPGVGKTALLQYTRGLGAGLPIRAGGGCGV